MANKDINNLYNTILSAGAYGAKLCGAGGGGFFIVLANKIAINKIKDNMKKSMIGNINIDRQGIKTFNL